MTGICTDYWLKLALQCLIDKEFDQILDCQNLVQSLTLQCFACPLLVTDQEERELPLEEGHYQTGHPWQQRKTAIYSI